MDVSRASPRGVLSVGFNQDNSCISVATHDGFKIFNCDTCTCVYEYSGGAICLVEMLFCTSLVAMVGAGDQPSLSPRRLQLLNTSGTSPPMELSFVSSILAVRLNRKRLVVVLDKKVYIHDLENLALLDTLDTCHNPKGLCALSLNASNCHLALPGSATSGAALIYDALNLRTVCQIQAHVAPLSVLAFSLEGERLATASERGTVVRVFKVPQTTKIYSFRRGTYPAAIYSLSFSPSSSLLGATTENGTVHIFRLGTHKRQGGGGGGVAGQVLASVVWDLVADSVESERCFITIHNGSPRGVPSFCAITKDNTEGSDGRAKVLVVTSEGYFNEYCVHVTSRGAGTAVLERESTLIEGVSQQISAKFV